MWLTYPTSFDGCSASYLCPVRLLIPMSAPCSRLSLWNGNLCILSCRARTRAEMKGMGVMVMTILVVVEKSEKEGREPAVLQRRWEA